MGDRVGTPVAVGFSFLEFFFSAFDVRPLSQKPEKDFSAEGAAVTAQDSLVASFNESRVFADTGRKKLEPIAYAHITMNTPVLVRSRKLSIVEPG